MVQHSTGAILDACNAMHEVSRAKPLCTPERPAPRTTLHRILADTHRRPRPIHADALFEHDALALTITSDYWKIGKVENYYYLGKIQAEAIC